MIAHLAEVWVLLLAVFLVGCVGGALLFTRTASSRFASAQWVVVDALGRVGDSMRDRFGVAPIWRGRRLLPAPALPPLGTADREPTAVAGRLAEAEPVWEVVDRTVLSQSINPMPDPSPPVDDELLPDPIDMEALLAIAAQFDETPRVDEIASPGTSDEDNREAEEFVGDEEFLEDDALVEVPPAMIRPIFPPSLDAPSPQRAPLAHLAPPPAMLRPPVIRPDAERGSAAPAVPLLTARDDFTQPTDGLETRRPATLIEPRNGVPDNLRRIRGIGDRNEIRLNKLGIFHFSQIAAWTPAEVRWIGQQLAFPERIERDDWVGQAIVLATGGDTGFTKSVERRRARRRNGRDGDETDLD